MKHTYFKSLGMRVHTLPESELKQKQKKKTARTHTTHILPIHTIVCVCVYPL